MSFLKDLRRKSISMFKVVSKKMPPGKNPSPTQKRNLYKIASGKNSPQKIFPLENCNYFTSFLLLLALSYSSFLSFLY